MSDLVADLPDYRHRDGAHQALAVTGDAVSSTESLFIEFLGQGNRDSRSALSSLGQLPQEIDFDQLVRVIVMWTQRLGPFVNRRELISKLSAALTVAVASPLFDALDPDDSERVARTILGSSDFDEPTLRYCDAVASHLRRQGDVLGPQLALHSAIGHRDIARELAKSAPAALQQWAISVYGELTQLVGWLCFNMGDYRSAEQYYDDARSAAHNAQNIELGTYVLCSMSHLATWQGKVPVGIDHAIVAQAWAARTGSPRAEAYASDVAARAFAADRQVDSCHKALEVEHAAVARIEADAADPLWWGFYDEAFFWGTTSECALRLRDPDRALEAASKSLAISDSTNVHNCAFTVLFQGEALVQKENIAEASQVIGEVVKLTATNTSLRINQRITELRTALTPWKRSKPVRELDELLTVYRRSPGGSGST